jgi:hypothetical protein
MMKGGEMLSYDQAERLEQAAIEGGQPTPREASEVLLRETARRLRQAADADRGTQVLTVQLRHRELRAQRVPLGHPDHLGYGQIGNLIGRHPMVVKRHLETFARRHPSKIPPYAANNGQPSVRVG